MNIAASVGSAEQRFLDLAGELAGDVVDLDSRCWLTLLLLVFRPGFLSAEFIAGRRARYLPQMIFLLLPLFALLVRLAYLFSPFHYLQHLLFSLHYHSFVYLLYLLYLIARLIELAGANVGGWLLLALFIYLPLAFHRTYGSRFGAALGKSILVYISYGVLMVQGFFVVALMALVLL